MKSSHKAVIKSAGPFALMGAGALTVIGNPVAWAALAYATFRVGKSAYDKAKVRATLDEQAGDPDLFI